MTNSSERAGPPRARMAFRVGVVGHRPHRLPSDIAGLEAIRARLAEVLASVARAVGDIAQGPDGALYTPEAPVLRAVSPLAEGADRLFAEEALELGYHLCCVMPFALEEFERDFQPPQAMAPNALASFRDLLARAQGAGGLTTFELDGAADRRNEAYDAASQVVLNQSDLLVAVWDGRGAGGVGGTVDTLRDAIAFNVPVIWIDSRAPNACKILRRAEDIDCLGAGGDCPSPAPLEYQGDRSGFDKSIAELVRGELGLSDGGGERARFLAYLNERKPRYNLAFAWKMFRDLLDRGRLTAPRILVPDFIDQVADDWPVTDTPQPSMAVAGATWINTALRQQYAWSDKLADRYADAHRSGFIWSSLLAATAVFLALLPMAAAWNKHLASGAGGSMTTAVVEAFVLAIMVSLPILARRWRWHQRWLEYRVLAELIRELRILIPLGGGRPLPRTPAHLASYGDPTQSWMYWQTRAIARAVGLPNARVESPYVADQLAYLSKFVGAPGQAHAKPLGQIGFHQANCERMEHIHARLHGVALLLFAVTIVGVCVNLVAPLAMTREPPWMGRWLILTSAFLPALGAAMASINNQGEFARLQRRSRAMADGLTAIQSRLIALGRQPTATLSQVTALAARTAAMMVDENIDWRIVVLDLPHAAG